jgi:uncharacterized membrane protein YkvA (DUF1232 family)
VDKTWNATEQNDASTTYRVPDQAEFTRSVASLADMLRAMRLGTFSLTGKDVVMLVGAVVYILSPLDLVPEALLGPVGLIDDLVVLLGAFGVVQAALGRFRRR